MRTIIIYLVLTIMAPLCTIAQIKGDVNADGSVGIGDIVAVTNVMAGIMTDASAISHADVNKDGSVGIGDIVAITNIMAGKDTGSHALEGVEAIDMGLPSGTLWANMNVGATALEEAGDYFAWGETEPKSTYNWSTYIHCNGSLETCYIYGYEIAGTEYDAATVQWGEPWYTPSLDQINELMENCTKEWTTVNNVNVCKYISKINGKTIFLPAAGHIIEGELKDAGVYGFYWTSSWRSSEVEGVCPLLCAYMNIPWWTFDHRCYGLTVRPVR